MNAASLVNLFRKRHFAARRPAAGNRVTRRPFSGSHRFEQLEPRMMLSMATATVASFLGPGKNPASGVIEDSSGNLFGTTYWRRRVWVRHGVRVGQRERYDHHPRLVQWNQWGQSRAGVIEDPSGNLFGTTA